ncbi:class E sortase [Alloscardovia theropitheci]|uniref:Class E sortase n=1 Tax=Alloscardovia theropitheci TaxID=2496842 RepID=A0A4R0R037_9BIFI|nr:class E sortase [Alloscardovia theropitheci]TCD54346.1 class E sortase [Alloscardovia theropitheci]
MTDETTKTESDFQVDNNPDTADTSRASTSGSKRAAKSASKSKRARYKALHKTVNPESIKRRRIINTTLGVIGEVFLTFAVVCALYIVWQLWWTGVEAEKTQINDSTTSSWTAPASQDGSTKIAPDNSPDTAPVQEGSYSYGATLGKLYIPRFGQNWSRTLVEGTDDAQLNRHGLGHYSDTQKPGEVGNFAIAGHRAGYGEPLGNADQLTKGDYIVMRTQDYWYVYQYDSTEIVTPDKYDVIAPVPGKTGATPTERYITLTTCEPKYATATHRLIVHGKLVGWSKVADGVPSVLAQKSSDGKVTFTTDSARSLSSRIPELSTVALWLVVAYVVIAIAGAVAWRWPALRAYMERDKDERGFFSLYGWFMRIQPGIMPVRIVLAVIAALLVAVVLFKWGYPWAATHIPYLQVSSNYVAVN